MGEMDTATKALTSDILGGCGLKSAAKTEVEIEFQLQYANFSLDKVLGVISNGLRSLEKMIEAICYHVSGPAEFLDQLCAGTWSLPGHRTSKTCTSSC